MWGVIFCSNRGFSPIWITSIPRFAQDLDKVVARTDTNPSHFGHLTFPRVKTKYNLVNNYDNAPKLTRCSNKNNVCRGQIDIAPGDGSVVVLCRDNDNHFLREIHYTKISAQLNSPRLPT